jgi:hypothetical protein
MKYRSVIGLGLLAIGLIGMAIVSVFDQSRAHRIEEMTAVFSEKERSRSPRPEPQKAEEVEETQLSRSETAEEIATVSKPASFSGKPKSPDEWQAVVDRWKPLIAELEGWEHVIPGRLRSCDVRDWEEEYSDFVFDVFEKTHECIQDIHDLIDSGLDLSQAKQEHALWMFFVSDVQRWVDLLCLEAEFAMEVGQKDRAYEAILRGIRLGMIVGEMNDLQVSGYQRAFIVESMIRCIQKVFDPGELSREQSHRLYSMFSGESTRLGSVDKWNMKIVQWIQTPNAGVQAGEQTWDRLRRAITVRYPRGVAREVYHLGKWYTVGKRNARTEHLTYLDFLNFEQEHWSLPYYEYWPELGRNVGADAFRYAWVHRRSADLEAQIDMLRTGIMVELYREEQGSWPRSLRDVADHYIQEVLIDPFTGEPFKYRVSDDDFDLGFYMPQGIESYELFMTTEKSRNDNFVSWRRTGCYEGQHENAMDPDQFDVRLNEVLALF